MTDQDKKYERPDRQANNLTPAEKRWLLYFYDVADFGPSHDDVIRIHEDSYQRETGETAPWRECDECCDRLADHDKPCEASE